jgi:hypothetical protein
MPAPGRRFDIVRGRHQPVYNKPTQNAIAARRERRANNRKRSSS